MKPSEKNALEFLKDTVEPAKKNTVKMTDVSVHKYFPDIIYLFEIISDHQCGDTRYIGASKCVGSLNCYVTVKKICYRLS